MSRILRRWSGFVALAVVTVWGLYAVTSNPDYISYLHPPGLDFQRIARLTPHRDAFRKWVNTPTRFPVKKYLSWPYHASAHIPRIQHDFDKYRESPMHAEERERRREAVKEAFLHSWHGYKEHAWMQDEVKPISGGPRDSFGGWGATLVDTLDTLWIMGLEDEFHDALAGVKRIDFTVAKLSQLNVYETVIRYIGGLLGAYDISGGKYTALLNKAMELGKSAVGAFATATSANKMTTGEFMYHSFDTPNRLPITRWDWQVAEAAQQDQYGPEAGLLGEIGAMTLEFTRLAQVTGDPKYWDAVQRVSMIMSKQQNKTLIPGLWPIQVNANKTDFTSGTTFTIGGMTDAVYEYLPKQYLLLSGRDDIYKDMYLSAFDSIKRYLAFEPFIPLQSDQPKDKDKPKDTKKAYAKDNTNADEKPLPREETKTKRAYEFSPDYANPLLLGSISMSPSDTPSRHTFTTESQHLSCFAGGMAAIGARAFAPFQKLDNIQEDMDVAERLAAGCIWSYQATATGIGPEIFRTSACRRGRAAITSGDETDWTSEKAGSCRWERERWLKEVRALALASDADLAASAAQKESDDPDFWSHYAAEHHLSDGFTFINDARYMLRPQAAESLFVLWRVTGDPKYQDQAWAMFQSIDAIARTKLAYTSLADVTVHPTGRPAEPNTKRRRAWPLDRRAWPVLGGITDPVDEAAYIDNMESYWTAETLKYFWLIFADTDVVSLDRYVLSTQGHPFRWRDGPPERGRNNG